MMSDEGRGEGAESEFQVVVSPLVITHGKSSANRLRKYAVYFSEDRHNDMTIDPSQKAKVTKWRMKDRMKTISVALVLCLNLGVDPPDVIKTFPCARMETWIDPTQMQSQKALETIGKRLQEQYERWQGKARYKQCLDPTVEDVKKLCLSTRRHAKDERVLFHYNGHGVPRPTANGEIWVFNKGFTQYIPLSIYDLQTWVGSPAIYVFDCNSAGTIVNWFNQFADQREKDYERMVSATGGAASPPPLPALRDCILLAACGASEILPMSPEYPADMFTACLTTPIKMALRWFCSHTILTGITMDMIDKIPGHLTTRRTPLGELNWIFTAVTDTIAWNVLPRELFQKLFRQDLLVASLFRNFLLAERIMRGANCTPVSSPALPSTYMHPMWQAWDLAVDVCLSQFPAMLNNPNLEFKHSPFFTEQLTAFEVWLESGNEHKPPPEQLPIVLQVLLSQAHRLRALVLLGRFLDLGPWAVNLALSVGIFPYVLRLLVSPASDLRQILVFIWAKILALDKSCQLDLVKDNGHHYFITVLSTPNVPADQRAMAAFVLTVIVNNCRPGQSACLNGNLLSICLQQTNDTDPAVRRWMVICLSKLWENFEEAKAAAIREGAHEKLCAMLQDVEPEVRAAAVYGLGTFVGGAEGNEQRINIELNIGLTLPILTADSSPLVRRELVIALSHLVAEYDEKFKVVAQEFVQEERLRVMREAQQEEERRKQAKDSKRSRVHVLSEPGPLTNPANQIGTPLSSVYGLLWKLIIQLCLDPYPEVAQLATEVERTMTSLVVDQDPSSYNQPASGPKSSRPQLSTSANMRPSPKKQVPALNVPASSSVSSSAPRSKLGHQRNSSLSQSGGGSAATSPEGGNNVTIAGGTSNIANSIIADYNGASAPGTPTRRFGSSMEYAYGVGFGDDYLTSSYYEWGASFYAKPLIAEQEDPNSPRSVEQRWRSQRNDRIIQEAWELNDPNLNPKTDTQISILDSEGAEAASLLQFHPFENLIVVAGTSDALSVWNWDAGQKLHIFSNSNQPPTRITSMKFINDYDKGLLVVGSNDGVIRIWGGIESPETLRLVSAWRALREVPAPQPLSSTSMVMDWQQESGKLLVAGDVSFVRVWDAERELSTQDVPTECPVGVTGIASQQQGHTFAIGCQDGSIRLFDSRLPSKYSLVNTFSEHKNWIVNVAMPKFKDNTIASCTTMGEVRLWQASYSTPTLSINNNDATTSLAVHDFAPILATGSQSQKIRLINFNGEVSLIRYHDGFLGQRIGPVSSLSYHPYKLYLAAGATDSIVSIYTGDNTGRPPASFKIL